MKTMQEIAAKLQNLEIRLITNSTDVNRLLCRDEGDRIVGWVKALRWVLDETEEADNRNMGEQYGQEVIFLRGRELAREVYMPNLVRRRCGYCDGTGEVDVGEFVPDYRPCPVCQRTGEVRVPSTYGICGICGGSGKEDIGRYVRHIVRCGNCKGCGWAPPPPAYR
jgi:hypothetical protein